MLESVIRYEPEELVRYFSTDIEYDLWTGWEGNFPHLLRPCRLPADPGADGVIVLPKNPDSQRGWQPVGKEEFQSAALTVLDRPGAGRPRTVAGLEFVLCPPKSFSILALAYRRHALVRCHLRAVADFLAVLGMLTAVRGGGRERKVWPGGFLFTHALSHLGDPHLHTHIVLLSQGEHALNTWPILHVFRGLLGWVYEYGLTSRLSRKYPLEVLNPKNADWRITGLPDGLAEVFSKASAQIRAAAQSEGDVSRRNRYRLARKIRREAEEMHPTLKIPIGDAMRSWMPVVESFPLGLPMAPGRPNLYERPDPAWLLGQLCQKSFAREEEIFEALLRRNFLASKPARGVWRGLKVFLGEEVDSGSLLRIDRRLCAPTIMEVEEMLRQRFAPVSTDAKVETNTSADPVAAVARILDAGKPEHRVVCIAEAANPSKVRKKLAELAGEKAKVVALADTPPPHEGSPPLWLVVDAQADLRELRPWLLWPKSDSALRIVVCGVPPRGSVWYAVMGIRLYSGVEPKLKAGENRIRIVRANTPGSLLGLSTEVIRQFFASGTVLVFAPEKKRRQELSLEMESVFHRAASGAKIKVASPLPKGIPVGTLAGKVILGLWGSGLRPAHQLWKIAEDKNLTFFVPFRWEGRRWPLDAEGFSAVSDRFAVVEEKRCAPGAQFVCLAECGGGGSRRLEVGNLVQIGDSKAKARGPKDRKGRPLPPLMVAEPCYTLDTKPMVWPKTKADYILLSVGPDNEALIPQLIQEISKCPPAREIVLLSENPSRLREMLPPEYQDDVREEMDISAWRGPYAAWLALQPAEMKEEDQILAEVGEIEEAPACPVAEERLQGPAGDAMPQGDLEPGGVELHYKPEKPSPSKKAIKPEAPKEDKMPPGEEAPVSIVTVIKKKPKKKVKVKDGMAM